MAATPRRFRFAAAGAAFALGLAVAVADARAPGERPSPLETADALTRILAVPDEPSAINGFIGTGRQPADVVARRAAALLRGLADRRGTVPPAAYLGAVSRISTLAGRALASASIVGLAVATGYRPKNVVIALDFGPPEGPVMPGFERVLQGDRRIEGRILALRRPGSNLLLSDGLAGIEKITLSVAPGDYRVILITQNLADPAVSRLPFGRTVRINGIPTRIERSDFREWRYEAMLAGGRSRLPESGGHRSGELASDGAALFSRQQGGAVILEAKTSSDKLVIELADFAGARSYLTGLLVERLGRVSDVALSPPALGRIVPLSRRLELEAGLLEEAARAIEGIAPAIGRQTPLGDTVVSQDS